MEVFKLTVFLTFIYIIGANYCFKNYTPKENGKSRCRSRLANGGREGDQCCLIPGVKGYSANRKGLRCISCSEEPIIGSSVWSDWSDWRPCSVTCGNGTQLRYRVCQSDSCSGNSVDLQPCLANPCPVAVDGGWTRWTRWSQCSVTCGKGQRYISRTCTNPPPSNGGRECVGTKRIVKSCMKQPCVVDGSWSSWSSWSSCSMTCEHGIVSRTRQCNNPSPKNGGKFCVGQPRESSPCFNEVMCPVHGGLTEWAEWSICGAAGCGATGHRYRHRHCTNPVPKYGGSYCSGRMAMTEVCIKNCTATIKTPTRKCKPKLVTAKPEKVLSSYSSYDDISLAIAGDLEEPSYIDPDLPPLTRNLRQIPHSIIPESSSSSLDLDQIVIGDLSVGRTAPEIINPGNDMEDSSDSVSISESASVFQQVSSVKNQQITGQDEMVESSFSSIGDYEELEDCEEFDSNSNQQPSISMISSSDLSSDNLISSDSLK